ncbi:MAG: hypothetical protein EOO20_02210 [Chryseobacterium sp.]|nr:MAG: hypothetical protein EOO20_02210 [Chryseobacterium sp.]
MSYEEKAFQILKESINSAIFIDEKAKDFFADAPVDDNIAEEKLSKDLYSSFKSEGISLAVHKFVKTDIVDTALKSYLFKDRDLILLDWELDGNTGEEYSLSLLSEVVEYPHINFCCIYTRTPRFEAIYAQIETFFSGMDEADYTDIQTKFSFLEGDGIIELNKWLKAEDKDLTQLTETTGVNLADHPLKDNNDFSDLELVKSISNAFTKNVKPKQKGRRAALISTEEDSFIINNTLIFLFKKDTANDPKPSFLLRKIADQVVKNKNSFIQLLGLEMQSIFNSNESFIDENLLNSSTNALFSHRNMLKKKQKTDVTFSSIIKKILVEHASLRLRTAKLSLLNTDFLDEVSVNYNKVPEVEEVLSLNTFYNSVTVQSLKEGDLPSLNFGDIFYDGKEFYYLCITALCDCYFPNKIEHNYFFAVGKEIEAKLALSLGDTAFISFLPTGNCVIWGNIDIPKPISVKKAGLNDAEFEHEKLKAWSDALETFLYKPFYIKPKLFNVPGSKIEKNTIFLRDITYKTDKGVVKEEINILPVSYITTLRPDYTQRIANHSFSHPARVGVDFVKF